MSSPSRLWIPLAAIVAVIAIVVALKISGPAPDEPQQAREERAAETRRPRPRLEPRPAPEAGDPEKLQAADIVRLSPKDWEQRLAREYEHVEPEFKPEIILLATELEEALAGGIDPAGPEAHAYAETIRALLSERTEPGPEEPQPEQ